MLAEREPEPSPLPPPGIPCVEPFGSGGPEYGNKYYRARYYDPRIGRFISEDPIGFAGGINSYSYVRNQPVSASDPLGLFYFKGDPAAVRQAYIQQARLLSELSPRVIDYFKTVFGSDIVALLATGNYGELGTFPLEEKGTGYPSGRCHPPEMYINTTWDQFGNDALLFRATLLHEAAHAADLSGSNWFNRSFPFTDAEAAKIKVGTDYNMLDGKYGYAAEVLQFGRIITIDRK